MKTFNVRVSVNVQLQGANSPQEAEQHAWKRIEALIKAEPLARVTAAQASESHP